MCHYDLQNHLSIWHDSSGLVVGGGNSVHDPRISTFRFGSLYLADSGSVSGKDGTCRAELTYGSIRARVEITVEDGRTIRIAARTAGTLPPDSEFAIHLPYRRGDIFRASQRDTPLEDVGLCEEAGGDTGGFTVGPLAFQSSAAWRVSWPETPVDGYAVPLRLPLESAVVRLAARLDGTPVEIRLTVEEQLTPRCRSEQPS